MKLMTKKITGILLIIVLTLQWVPSSLAESRAETDCLDKKPNYETLITNWKTEKTRDNKAYQKHFELARQQHHDYMSCIFSFAEQEILKTGALRQGGTTEANTPNTDLIDWMAPEQACLSDDELKWVIQSTDPSQMLPAVLSAHKGYKDHLNALGNDYANSPIITDEKGTRLQGAEALIALSDTLGSADRQRTLEIESSLVAIDLMFTALKELRLAFVLHVRFQCMLKFLEEYRSRLEDLREFIEPLPNLLNNASTTK